MESPFIDAERAAFWDLFARSPLDLSERLGLAAKAIGEAIAFCSPSLSHLALSRVVGSHQQKNPTPEQLDECLSFFRSQGEERYLVQLPVDPRFEQIRGWLKDRGLVPYRRRWVQYERSTGPISRPSIDFDLRDARPEDGDEVGRILCSAFDCNEDGIPFFASIIGRDRWCVKVAATSANELMGVGMMYSTEASAYLAFGATAPTHRHKGVQRALMAARIAHALERGCNHICTETGEALPGEPNPSGNNMLRCGFRPTLTCDNWTRPGTTWLPT